MQEIVYEQDSYLFADDNTVGSRLNLHQGMVSGRLWAIAHVVQSK